MRSFISRNFFTVGVSLIFSVTLTACQTSATFAQSGQMSNDKGSDTDVFSSDPAYQTYLEFFEEVYAKMQEHYYQYVEREDYTRFIEKFNTKIYPQLKTTGKSIDFIRWRSAAFLVDHLKTKEDIFSAFYPPEPAKEYKTTALGKRVDLGINGTLLDVGFQVDFVEPRSDAYAKGLRDNDLILAINDQKVFELKEENVRALLNPLEDEETFIDFKSHADLSDKRISVFTKEFFKQTVFDVPLNVPDIYCLKLERFNRKTSEDMYRYINYYRERGPIKGLILDLRNNPGGPPLAAREISTFFLQGGQDFAYFEKKDEPMATLDVPLIPNMVRYDGPIVILVNEGSGSAAELFSGILQRKGRSILMGTNSAGQVMLKSMFHFDDESMVLLITAQGHHPDGTAFSFSGLKPDRYVPEDDNENLIKYAAQYLYYLDQKG